MRISAADFRIRVIGRRLRAHGASAANPATIGISLDEIHRADRPRIIRSADLDRLPIVVDIPTAAKALGLSRSYAYVLAKEGRFPCRLIRVGTGYRVPAAELLSVLREER